ncbi:hypothetical protein WA538_002978 [Blastocystis sp. DL]
MRQGRKKSSKSSSARFRHRSIPYEVENQENATVMGVMGASSVGRSESMSLYYSMGPQREATPLPTLQRCPRRDSLVDYMKLPMIVTGSIPVKRVTEPPRLGSAELPLVLPTVMTSKPREPSKSDEPSLLKNASMLLDALFPNNTVYMNGKTRELTQSMRAEMRSILADLLRQTQTHDPSLTCFNHCDIVRSFLYDHIDRVFASLVHGCRFECVYGTSSRCALIMGICSCLPDVTPAAHRALYETVVDFYEAEREAGDGGDDDLYVKRTSYGQVHRLAELWNLLVSCYYEQYSRFEFAGGGEGSFDVGALRNCLFVLLRVSSVVSKYKAILVPGILKLFYIDVRCVHAFVRSVVSKWPASSSKKAIALLELLLELLLQCQLLTEAVCEEDVTALFAWLCRLVNGAQAEVSLQALRIFDNDTVLSNYIVHDAVRVRMIEECLSKNHVHWNDTIREIGESLFDHLLDYV